MVKLVEEFALEDGEAMILFGSSYSFFFFLMNGFILLKWKMMSRIISLQIQEVLDQQWWGWVGCGVGTAGRVAVVVVVDRIILYSNFFLSMSINCLFLIDCGQYRLTTTF